MLSKGFIHYAHSDPQILWHTQIPAQLDPYSLGTLGPLAHLDPYTLRTLGLLAQFDMLIRQLVPILKVQTTGRQHAKCLVHLVHKKLISILVTDHIQKRRGKALLFSFEYNLLPNLISKFNHYMDRAYMYNTFQK